MPPSIRLFDERPKISPSKSEDFSPYAAEPLLEMSYLKEA